MHEKKRNFGIQIPEKHVVTGAKSYLRASKRRSAIPGRPLRTKACLSAGIDHSALKSPQDLCQRQDHAAHHKITGSMNSIPYEP